MSDFYMCFCKIIKNNICFQEDGKSEIDRNFKPNVMMCGRSPSEHVLHAISSVHPNDIEYTLTVCDVLSLHII